MNHKGNVVNIDICLNNVSQNDAWCFSNRIAEEQSSRVRIFTGEAPLFQIHRRSDGSLLAASATAVVAVAASLVVVVVSTRR